MITLEQAEIGVAQLQDALTKVQLGLDTAGRVQKQAGTIRRVVVAVLLAAGVGTLVVVALTVLRRRKAPKDPETT